jgi:hypothetical protein
MHCALLRCDLASCVQERGAGGGAGPVGQAWQGGGLSPSREAMASARQVRGAMNHSFLTFPTTFCETAVHVVLYAEDAAGCAAYAQRPCGMCKRQCIKSSPW